MRLGFYRLPLFLDFQLLGRGGFFFIGQAPYALERPHQADGHLYRIWIQGLLSLLKFLRLRCIYISIHLSFLQISLASIHRSFYPHTFLATNTSILYDFHGV